MTRWGKFEISGGVLSCWVEVGLVIIGFAEVAEEEEATGID